MDHSMDAIEARPNPNYCGLAVAGGLKAVPPRLQPNNLTRSRHTINSGGDAIRALRISKPGPAGGERARQIGGCQTRDPIPARMDDLERAAPGR